MRGKASTVCIVVCSAIKASVDLCGLPLWPLNTTILVPYFESTNSSLLGICALWNFDGNTCPLLQLLNYFIIIGKLYLWDYRSKQILPNIYGFRAKIIAKYETEEKIINKEFFKRKWILTPYLS